MKQREMRLLWELNRTGSVTAAADRVAMTQPAASALLRQLEERLGFALFDRTKRRLTLTVKGRALLPDIAHALAALEGLSRTADTLRNKAPRRTVIASVASASAVLLPLAARVLQGPDGSGTVVVRIAMSLDIENMVAEESVDFGLVVREARPTGEGCARIAPLGLWAIGPAGDPLLASAEDGPLDIARVAERPYIALGRQFTVGTATAAALEGRGAGYRPAVETMHFSAACAFVAEGWGIAILDTLGASHAHRQGLATRPLQPAAALALDLLWRPQSSAGTQAPRLAEALSSAYLGLAAELPGGGRP